VHSRTVPLRLGGGTSGHVERIWRRRSHDTQREWIRAIGGGQWAQGKSDPLKSHEEACTEWVAHVVSLGGQADRELAVRLRLKSGNHRRVVRSRVGSWVHGSPCT
jgi:hypothetical protein